MRGTPTLSVLNASAAVVCPNDNVFSTAALSIAGSTLTPEGGSVDLAGFTGFTVRLPAILRTNALLATAEV